MVTITVGMSRDIAAVGLDLFALAGRTSARALHVAVTAVVRLAQIRLARAAIFVAVGETILALLHPTLTVAALRGRMFERADLVAGAAVFGIVRSGLTAVVDALIAIEITLIAPRQYAASADAERGRV
jgi:tetrahydromethanopterin S-methyltransferase subunit E